MTINKIFCYTGTGNCLAAANQLSSAFDNTPVTFITEELIKATPSIECDFAVVVLPSYAYGLPKLVRRFFKETSFKISYLAIAVLMGSSQRGTAAEAIKILKRKGQYVSYSSGVASVENYVPLFGHPKNELITRRTAEQTTNINALITAYKNGETNSVSTVRPLSAFVSAVFRGASLFFPKCYRITKDCNGCELCRMICPPNTISMTKRKNRETLTPKFKARKCDHCQACLQLCPKKAIRFPRIKPTSPRYRHVDISLKDLIKRD